MHGKRRLLGLAAGAFLFAALVFGFMAAPGFLSDLDSTVPRRPQLREAGR